MYYVLLLNVMPIHSSNVYIYKYSICLLQVCLIIPSPACKHAHLRFRSDVQEVEPEYVCWNATLLSIVTKHANTTTLGKLPIFIIEVLCRVIATLLV